MTLRVRQDTERKTFPWHLRYLGQSEIGDKNRATMVRSCIDVACSSNIGQFLTEMGFKLHFTFLTRGYMFKKGRMKVIVAKIFRTVPGTEAIEPLTQSYLVEVSQSTQNQAETFLSYRLFPAYSFRSVWSHRPVRMRWQTKSKRFPSSSNLWYKWKKSIQEDCEPTKINNEFQF
jgi:hypothetical protein